MDANKIQLAYSPESFREEGHKLIDLLAEHLESTLSGSGQKVIRWTPPMEEHQYWLNYLEDGDREELFGHVLDRIIHIHHPNYMGHQISPSLPITGLTSLMSSLLNNGMGIYEMGAAPTAMERIVTDNICKTIGYQQTSRGILTSGGTLANLTALLSARQHFLGKKVNGSPKERQLAVMVSEEAHYCIERAVKIMGLGEKGIVKIPTDVNYRIRTDLLKKYHQDARQNGIEVFALVGCAPSTATGIYDDIDRLQQFASELGIWFHIDAAHGGAAIFSSKYESLLKGAENANSITIDGHKMMMMPGITTALLFKDGQSSHNTFRQKADYLLEESEDEDWYNLAKRTFECTKHMMSLHWYVSLKYYGPEIFDDFVTGLYDLASDFANLIEEDPEFELAVRPMSNIVCFRYSGSSTSNIAQNELNKMIRQKVLETGTYYIVQTRLGELHYLRTTIMNPFSTTDHFKGLLSHIKELAKEISS
ncbi:MAG: pyridoxal phosphate-dependent decarboxylase family protein [Flavobacteriaceae bacterium]